MLIDTHTHLYWDEYQADLDEVVSRANQAQIDTVVTIGVDLPSSQKAADFTHPNLKVYSSIGIHPHEAKKYQNSVELDQAIKDIETIYQNHPQKVIAVGECGLDFFFHPESEEHPAKLSTNQIKDLQRQLLQAQTNLAKKLNLPLIIHCRNGNDPITENAWAEVFDIIGDHYGILHCYSGDEIITQKALNSRFLVSFAANITYPKNQYLRDAAIQLPLSKIVLETDCPFLSPQKTRGQRNEPASVLLIAQLISELKSVPLEQVIDQTTTNFHQLLTAS